MMEHGVFLSGGHPENERDDMKARVMAREIETRPAIVEPMAHWLLWQGWTDPSQALSKAFELDPFSDDTYSDDAFQIFAHIYFWIVSLDDERSRIQSDATEETLAFWRDWMVENGPYLRFDSTAGRFRLDDDAKRAEQPDPREAQATKSLKTPFANWNGAPHY